MPLDPRWQSSVSIQPVPPPNTAHPRAHDWLDCFISEAFLTMLARALEDTLEGQRTRRRVAPRPSLFKAIKLFCYFLLEQCFCPASRQGLQDDELKRRFSRHPHCSWDMARRIKDNLSFDWDKAADRLSSDNLNNMRLGGYVCIDEGGIKGPKAALLQTKRARPMPNKEPGGEQLLPIYRLAGTMQGTGKRVVIALRFERPVRVYSAAEHLTWSEIRLSDALDLVLLCADAAFCDVPFIKARLRLRITTHLPSARGGTVADLVGVGLQEGEHRHVLDGPVIYSALVDGGMTHVAVTNAYQLSATMAAPRPVPVLSSHAVATLSHVPMSDLKKLAARCGVSAGTSLCALALRMLSPLLTPTLSRFVFFGRARCSSW